MRYISPYILKDLKKKMVFIGGPRQCGKTTLAKSLLTKWKNGQYFNWDFIQDQKKILALDWTDHDELLIFDEIHKYAKWKNFIKGLFDKFNDQHKFIVTGSSRLDIYRRGGDSLLGRYHYWRLHPFTLDELPKKITPTEGFKRLMSVGGFPEPFLDFDIREARRWREERYDKIIRDDIRDLENVKNISQLSLLLQLLRERAGGLIVASNLAQDIQVSTPTILKWIEVFERMYLIFRVYPYSKNMNRSLVKPFKIYFFDNADVLSDDEGVRFENLVANHLIKKCHFLQDYYGERWELTYLRDREGHEIDFALICDGVLQEMIEAKWSDQNLSPHFDYYWKKIGDQSLISPENKKPKSKNIKVTQIVATIKNSITRGHAIICNPLDYFGQKY